MTLAMTHDAADRKTDANFFALLTESYARLVGTSLVPQGRDATWLYRDASVVVLAHGTDSDPHFTYANKAAQDCFGYSWEEFLALPSRLSAETQDQAERQSLLDQVQLDGFMSGYRGVRIAKSGRRFIIADGVIWELLDKHGARHGQAATFSSWRDV